jgi:hypothetical protein
MLPCIIPPTHLKEGKEEAEEHPYFGHLDAGGLRQRVRNADKAKAEKNEFNSTPYFPEHQL